MVESSKKEREETSGTASVMSDRRARRKRKREGDDAVAENGAVVTTAKKETATRTREEAELDRIKASQARGESLPLVGRLVAYFRGVVAEIKKVTWPTREEAQRLTTIVLLVTVLASVTLGAIDFFYGWWFQQGLENAGVYLLIGAIVLVVVGGLSWRFILREEG